jgi:hypothetical protein
LETTNAALKEGPLFHGDAGIREFSADFGTGAFPFVQESSVSEKTGSEAVETSFT